MQRRRFLKTASGLFVPAACGIVRAQPFQLNDPALLAATRGASAPPYSATATAFSGTGQYFESSTLTGNNDSKILLISLWFKKGLDGVQQRLINSSASNKVLFYFKSDNTLNIQGRNAASANILVASIGAITGTAWHHIAFSVDLASSSNRTWYLDGSPQTPTWTTYTNDTLNPTSTTYICASTAAADLFTGSICELWMSTNEASYIDLATSITKFRSSGAKPVNLGTDGSTPTGTKPSIYSKTNAASLTVNSSGYGNFTVAGTPTADTPP